MKALNIKELDIDKKELSDQTSSAFEKHLSLVKTDYNLNDIYGISQLDEKGTLIYCKENHLPHMNFIIDQQNTFNKELGLPLNCEILIENNKVIIIRKDPSLFELIFGCVSNLLLIGVSVTTLLTISIIFKYHKSNSQKENEYFLASI